MLNHRRLLKKDNLARVRFLEKVGYQAHHLIVNGTVQRLAYPHHHISRPHAVDVVAADLAAEPIEAGRAEAA